MQNIPEWINKCLNDTEVWVSELEYKGVEITGGEQKKEKKNEKKWELSKRSLWKHLMHKHSHNCGPKKRRESKRKDLRKYLKR